MKLYSCKVRLAGNVLNEVPKRETTAAEIMMLRFIHGDDAVIDVTESGEDRRRTSDGERDRLALVYRDFIGKTKPGDVNPIIQLFGPNHLPLPTVLKIDTPAPTAPEHFGAMLA